LAIQLTEEVDINKNKMNIEIERKFLIKNLDFIEEAKEKVKITQGFLSSAPERTVRVRLKGEK